MGLKNKPQLATVDSGFHGAREVIRLAEGKLSKAIRVYPEGVRVGCTWLGWSAWDAMVEQVNKRRLV